jgi:hypothetical protein
VGFFDKVKATAQAGRLAAAGADFLGAGDLDRAQEMFGAAADAVRPFGIAHPPVRGALWNHAISLVYVGRYAEARDELRAALTIQGPRTPIDPLAIWNHADAPHAIKKGAVASVLQAMSDMQRHAGRLGTVLDPRAALPALISFDREHGDLGEAQGLESCLARSKANP